MNRRDFLATTIMSSAAGLGDDAPLGGGFIDAHSHIWTRDIDAYPLARGVTLEHLAPPSFTVEELLNTAGQLGVGRVVLIQHRPFHGVDNSYITDTIARYPGVFSAVACIDATVPRPQDEMGRLKRLGVRGFRIRPGEGGARRFADSEGICTMWQYAGEIGVAICPLIDAEHTPEVDEMCTRFPDTTVVIDHFARIGVDGDIREADLAKVSAFYALGNKQPPHTELIPMIRRLYDAFGPARLMWASDSPYQLLGKNTYADSLALIRDRIDFLTPADKHWLLRKTAARVYFGESDLL
jgi:predicted TIM-barrel fold metal-dependent hydrolase